MNVFLRSAFIFLGVFVFTGGSCPSNDTTASNKVAQSEIYQSYSVTQIGDSYDVMAYFRVGGRTGTTLALVAPSRITINGQVMKENLNTSSGTFYSTTIPTSTTSGTFVFTDRNSKSYTNNIDLSRVAINASKTNSNGAEPLAVPLSRAPGETASLTLQLNNRLVFVDAAKGEMSEAFYDRTARSIVILPTAWKDLPNGSVSLDLEIRDNNSTQQGTDLGGEMTFTYDAAPVQISLAKAKSKPAKTTAVGNTTKQ
jgi:hypothetical protein